MKSERRIQEPRLSVIDGKLSTFRFRVKGGRTGDHYIQWLNGDWRCDCQGWSCNKVCRHVKAGGIMLEKLTEALYEIDRREEENWKIP